MMMTNLVKPIRAKLDEDSDIDYKKENKCNSNDLKNRETVQRRFIKRSSKKISRRNGAESFLEENIQKASKKERFHLKMFKEFLIKNPRLIIKIFDLDLMINY